uniref:Receptor ligand binding region domain-containing protein n=1 Tax=Magallana gigas TaxID=29159 RepID=K1Q688_MAGGI
MASLSAAQVPLLDVNFGLGSTQKSYGGKKAPHGFHSYTEEDEPLHLTSNIPTKSYGGKRAPTSSLITVNLDEDSKLTCVKKSTLSNIIVLNEDEESSRYKSYGLKKIISSNNGLVSQENEEATSQGGKRSNIPLTDIKEEGQLDSEKLTLPQHGSKRGASGPLVTSSDEEESLPPSPRSSVNSSSSVQHAYEHDHDYENVASPSGSSTASGPVYIRPPGFRHHAQEIKKVKKKKTTEFDFKSALKKRAPTPPKVRPKRDMRPITPPDEKERHKKQPKQSERKVYITGDTDLLLKHLFDRAVEDKKNPQIKRGRPRKIAVPRETGTKALISGDDPYLVDAVTQKLFPQLSLESRQGQIGSTTLQLVTLRDGDKQFTSLRATVQRRIQQSEHLRAFSRIFPMPEASSTERARSLAKICVAATSPQRKLWRALARSIEHTSEQSAQIVLEWDTNYEVPNTPPADADRAYNLPLNHISGKPLIAWLKDGPGGNIMNTTSGTFNLSSVDKLVHGGAPQSGDTWLSSGGQLCQYSPNQPFPLRYEGFYWKFRCSSNSTPDAMLTIPFYNGELRADHLYHQHPQDTLPPQERYYFIESIVNGSTINLASANTFTISKPAKLLVFSEAPPSTVVANTNFNVSVEIWAGDNTTLTTGLDSTLTLTLQVAYFEGLVEHYSSVPLEDMVSEMHVRLAGDHVIQSKATYDFVHNERAVAGKASFTGLRLLDVHSCVKLNITMKMPGYPHSRLPNTYTDNTLKFVYDIAGKKKAFVYNGTSDPAVLISDCINVTEQSLNKVVIISDPLKPKQGANFPIEPYIVLELQDADGQRIYSGRDSNLILDVKVNNSTVCLSNDSATVQAKDGRALGSAESRVLAVGRQIANVFINSTTSKVNKKPNSVKPFSQLSHKQKRLIFVRPINFEHDIYLGNFINYYSSGSTSDTGPNLIVRQSTYRVNNILIQKAKDFGLEFVAEISIPFLPPPLYKAGLLQSYMDKIKSYGVRVIWMFMIPPLMALTLCEARDNNMTSYDGYQWGAIGQYGWYFPYENQYYKGCRDPNALPCSTAFKGWIGIDSTYDLKGLSTDHWKRVMERHLFTDRIQENYRGTNKKNKWLEILAVYALAYDAVIVYCEAMTVLMQKKETITADKLVAEIRKVTIEGLTGNITFEASGDRPGFRGFMCVVNPHPLGTYAPASHTAVFARTFILENTAATTQLEVPMQAKRPLSLPPYNHIVANFTSPDEQKWAPRGMAEAALRAIFRNECDLRRLMLLQNIITKADISALGIRVRTRNVLYIIT